MLLHDIQRPKEMGLTCTKYNVQLQTYTHILKGVGHFTPVERSQTTAEDNNDNVILSRESRVQGTLFSAGGQHTVDIEWVVRHTNPKICDLGYVTTISLTHTSKRHQSLSFNLTFRTPSQTICRAPGGARLLEPFNYPLPVQGPWALFPAPPRAFDPKRTKVLGQFGDRIPETLWVVCGAREVQPPSTLHPGEGPRCATQGRG